MEAEGLKFSALLCDIVQSSVRDFLILVAPNSLAAAAVTIGVFGIFIIGYIISGVVIFIYHFQGTSCCDDFSVILPLILQFIAGLLYMVGDNISPILRDYSDELNCNTTCIEVAVSVGEGLLALILPLYFFLLIQKWFNAFKKEQKKRTPIPPFDALRLVVFAHELDVVFTAIQRQVIPVSEACTTPYHIVAWAIWLGYIFSLAVATFVTLNCVTKDENLTVDYKRAINNCTIVTVSNVHLASVLLLTAAYLLADNNIPLSCSGDGNGVRGARFALWIPCVFVSTYITIIWGWKLYHKHTNDEKSADDAEFLAFDCTTCPCTCELTTFKFSIKDEA